MCRLLRVPAPVVLRYRFRVVCRLLRVPAPARRLPLWDSLCYCPVVDLPGVSPIRFGHCHWPLAWKNVRFTHARHATVCFAVSYRSLPLRPTGEAGTNRIDLCFDGGFCYINFYVWFLGPVIHADADLVARYAMYLSRSIRRFCANSRVASLRRRAAMRLETA